MRSGGMILPARRPSVQACNDFFSLRERHLAAYASDRATKRMGACRLCMASVPERKTRDVMKLVERHWARQRTCSRLGRRT